MNSVISKLELVLTELNNRVYVDENAMKIVNDALQELQKLNGEIAESIAKFDVLLAQFNNKPYLAAGDKVSICNELQRMSELKKQINACFPLNIRTRLPAEVWTKKIHFELEMQFYVKAIVELL